MNRILAALVVAVVVLSAVACGGGKKQPATPTAGATAAVGATPTVQVRHTGIAEVDAIIDAVLSGDVERVRPLVQFQPMTCTAMLQGIGAFYCATGEPDGTVEDVLPVAGCEGGYMRASELGVSAPTWFDNPTLRLFAVYRSGREIFIVFSRMIGENRDQPAGLVADTRGGRLVELAFGCGQTAEQFVANMPPEDFVMPPP